MSDTPTDADPTTDPASDTTTDRGTRDVLNTDTMQWVSALVGLVGLWIVASPFLFEATETAIWNNTIVGTVIFLLAGYNFYRMTKDRLASVGAAALAALLGLWILVTPFVMEMGSDELATSTAVSGLVVAALAAYNAYANNAADVTERAITRT